MPATWTVFCGEASRQLSNNGHRRTIRRTYKAVLIASEKFNHNLTLQFGLSADNWSGDNDYLEKANHLINDWKSDL